MGVATGQKERQDMSWRCKRKYRPRKVILKGVYYCPVVPELGHYENEGLWGYDKLVHIERNCYQIVHCLFKTKEERDEAYDNEVKNLMALGKAMLKRRTYFNENELDDLEIASASTSHAYKVVDGKTVRLIV